MLSSLRSSTSALMTRFMNLVSLDDEGRTSPKILSYIEFQSYLLKLYKTNITENLSTHLAFQNLISSETLFPTNSENKRGLTFRWPYHGGERVIVVDVTNNKDLRFFYKNKQFLTIGYQEKDRVIMTPRKTNQWSDTDISQIVDNFKMVLGAKKIINVSKNSQSVPHQKEKVKYNKESFAKLITDYYDYNLTARIENVIIKNAKRRGTEYTFKLDWSDDMQQQYRLKVQFSRMDTFGSKYFYITDEKTLLTQFAEFKDENIPVDQLYYSLMVNEIVETDKKHDEYEILKIWLTVDGKFGELRDLTKGYKISGSEVLNIYKFFDRLFQVKSTIFWDISGLEKDDQLIVPLRLIYALATGKTWYESKLPGVRLFECNKYMTNYDEEVTQNVIARETALFELQHFTIGKWLPMLSIEEQSILMSLYNEVYWNKLAKNLDQEGRNQHYHHMTLQELTLAILKDAKEKKEITRSLIHLVNLLTTGLSFKKATTTYNRLAANYWVKYRVEELLSGSFIWVKKSEHQDIQTKELRHASINCRL